MKDMLISEWKKICADNYGCNSCGLTSECPRAFEEFNYPSHWDVEMQEPLEQELQEK